MIKMICHKIFAVALSLLVLFSTFSFTVEKHFCGDHLIDMAIFSETKGCGMESEAVAKVEKPCCKDVLDIIEGQDDLIVKTFDDLEFSEQVFLTSFVYTTLNRFNIITKKRFSHKFYKPPLIVEDIQLLYDTFLI